MDAWRTTLVTVVFEPEAGLLDLQARSIAAHVPADLVAEVVVIDNGWRRMSDRRRSSLRALYGDHADRVRFVRASGLVPVPAAGGWAVQQILKLEIARTITTPTYLVLDAKNHFVAPLHREHLVDASGRPFVDAYSFRDHPHRQRLERVLRFAGLDPDDHLDRFTATVTPFLLERAQVLRAMALVAQGHHDFAAAFVAHGLTEFFLYSASVLADGEDLQDRFALRAQQASTVWPAQVDPASVAALAAAVRERGGPVFSVHRDAFAVLPTASQELLVDLWTAAGLFADRTSAAQQLRRVTRQTRRARTHKLAGRAVNSVRSRVPRRTVRDGVAGA
jgi:hypothetical protein